jgi:hypothetical protein
MKIQRDFRGGNLLTIETLQAKQTEENRHEKYEAFSRQRMIQMVVGEASVSRALDRSVDRYTVFLHRKLFASFVFSLPIELAGGLVSKQLIIDKYVNDNSM